MLGKQVIEEAKGGFTKSFNVELAPFLTDLGTRIFDRVKKYAHSPTKWRVEHNERPCFTFCEFETTDLSDYEVKGDLIIDWLGREGSIRVIGNMTGGVRGPTDFSGKVLFTSPLDDLVALLIGMLRDANLHQEK